MARKPKSAESLVDLAPDNFAKVIAHQSDLACVLIGVTFVEHALMSMLKGFFVKCDTSETIFKEGQLLGDFGKCTTIAYCLGLISNTTKRLLETVGKIRNLFAHHLGELNFSSPEIKEVWSQLVFPPIQGELGDKISWSTKTEREQFTLIVHGLFVKIMLDQTTPACDQRKPMPDHQ